MRSAALLPSVRGRGRAAPADSSARPPARRCRPDERAVCRPGRRYLCARGQSAGQPDSALRGKGDVGASGKIAARVMAGEPLASFGLTEPRLQHVAVKEAVLPFARFPGSDVVLGPEMKSTGESMGIDQDFATAYLKAQLGAGVRLPRSGNVLLSVRDADKPGIVDVARRLAHVGFRLLATRGTAEFLGRAGVP